MAYGGAQVLSGICARFPEGSENVQRADILRLSRAHADTGNVAFLQPPTLISQNYRNNNIGVHGSYLLTFVPLYLPAPPPNPTPSCRTTKYDSENRLFDVRIFSYAHKHIWRVHDPGSECKQ